MSKAGYSEESRLVLAHHSLGSKKRTLECNSREIQAAPLRELEECLSAIRTGNFLPDMTRSGMMAAPAKAVAPNPATHPRPVPETAEQTWLSRRAQSPKLALEVHSWASSVAETDSSAEVRLDSENSHLPNEPVDKAVDSHHFPDPVKGASTQKDHLLLKGGCHGLAQQGWVSLLGMCGELTIGAALRTFDLLEIKTKHKFVKKASGRRSHHQTGENKTFASEDARKASDMHATRHQAGENKTFASDDAQKASNMHATGLTFSHGVTTGARSLPQLIIPNGHTGS